MSNISENWNKVNQELPENVLLVAVSKYRSKEEFMALYNCGQRHFAENRVQELERKKEELPDGIHWHMIGHLQRNKVKAIAPWVHLIHSVDSVRLAKEINKQAKAVGRRIPCLLQVHIAQEDSKYGFMADGLQSFVQSDEFRQMDHIEWRGLMGMATNTDEVAQVKKEFQQLAALREKVKSTLTDPDVFTELSMGMSNDYQVAISCGSTILRLGSVLFE